MIVRALASLGPIGVGILFIVAAAAKLVAPGRFRTHLHRMGVIGHGRNMAPLPVALATGEVVAGAALISGLAPGIVAPAAVGMLAALSGVTIWSTASKRTDDCGCYGGLVEIRPEVSVLLNALYAALVIVGWKHGRPLIRRPARQATTIGLLGLIAAAVGALAEWRLRTADMPLINLNPMRPGKFWQPRWVPEHAERLAHGEQIVAFLSDRCHTCKLWGSPLNKINIRPDLPPVLGVMAASQEVIDGYTREQGITFPVAPMKKATFARLIEATPAIAVVKDGVVQSVTLGILPPALIERVKQKPPAPSDWVMPTILDGFHETPAEPTHP